MAIVRPFAFIVLAMLGISAARADDPGSLHVENQRGGAFRIGIYFQKSVPMAVRALIVDDLAWLAQVPVVPSETDFLAKTTGIRASPLTGLHLLAWILHHTRVVSDLTWCPYSSQWLIDGSRSETQPRLLPTHPIAGVCDDPVEYKRTHAQAVTYYGKINDGVTVRDWHVADPERKERDAALVDDRMYVAGETDRYLPFKQINADLPFFQEATFVARLHRLENLIHEAAHSRYMPSNHVACQKGSIAASGYNLPSFHIDPISIEERVCDDRWPEPHAIGLEFVHALSGCPACAPDIRTALAQFERDRWTYVSLSTNGPIALPMRSSTDGSDGRFTYTAIPPKRFFDATLQWLGSTGCKERCTESADLVREQVRLIEKGIAEGKVYPTWSKSGSNQWEPFFPLDLEGAKAWVIAAKRARSTGYNVEFVDMPHCVQFGEECSLR